VKQDLLYGNFLVPAISITAVGETTWYSILYGMQPERNMTGGIKKQKKKAIN